MKRFTTIISELSTDTLASYKKKAGEQASAADKAGNFAKGNKRFSGIIKATKKQFANDAKVAKSPFHMSKEEYDYLEERVKTTDEDPLVTVHDKDGLHTHANLSTANHIFTTNVKHTDVHKGPVKVKSGGSYGNVTFALSQHHAAAMKEEVELEEVAKPTGDLKDACWKGYTAVGMKEKNGKKVPNCVPEETQIDEIHKMPTKFNSLDPLSAKAVAKQKLMNLIKSGKAKGALIANQQRTLNAGDEIDQEDLDALNEVLSKDAKAGDWISDFVHSDNPKFAGKTKKERIKMALGAYYGKQNKQTMRTEEKDEQEYGYEGDMAMNQLETAIRHATYLKDMMKPDTDLPEWVQSKITLATDYLQTACDYMSSEMNEELVGGQKKIDKNKNGKLDAQDFKLLRKEEQYAGLEKEDKPGKIKTAVVKVGPKSVESDTVEGWKDAKKPVKESIDEEGNLMADKITFKEFMMMLEYEAKDGVYRHKGTYGGSYVDPEGADDADDKKPAQQPAVKRGRGRPAGSKSGARSTTGTSKLFK